jgi:NTP pyrophosphatase (non-canonical NTP hydrolase)
MKGNPKRKNERKFPELVSIVSRLRGLHGCPWDKAQDTHSLKPYLIEESYELMSALDDGDEEHIKEELGDLLLQIMLLSRIYEEKRSFSVYDVIESLSKKLVHRHPHVHPGRGVHTLRPLQRQPLPGHLSLVRSFPGRPGPYDHHGLRSFSAISGSNTATAATMSTVAIPAMKKVGYPVKMMFLVGAGRLSGGARGARTGQFLKRKCHMKPYEILVVSPICF